MHLNSTTWQCISIAQLGNAQYFANNLNTVYVLATYFVYCQIFVLLHIYSEGDSDQPIWLTDTDCTANYACLSSCASCPATQVATCSHYEDVDIHCRELIMSALLKILTSFLVSLFFFFFAEYVVGSFQGASTRDNCTTDGSNTDTNASAGEGMLVV